MAKVIKEVTIEGVVYVPKDSIKAAPSEAAKRDDMPYVIIRTYSSGVFAGFLKERGEVKDGYMRVVLVDARRIWYWKGAASLSQLAQSGTTAPKECKFPEPVSEIELMNAIEILKCTEEAYESIVNVPVWKA